MLQAIKHRGPDHSQVMQIGNWSLGFCRLKIIDLSSDSNQPYSELGVPAFLVFNGEIYNYIELQKEYNLPIEKTKSDTQVLYHLLLKFGSGILNKLDGMFSFVFIDQMKNEVLVARDRFGIKPLFKLGDNDSRIFTSEQKSLLFYPECEPKINDSTVADFFYFGHRFTENTLWQGVTEFFPGCYEIYNMDSNLLKVKGQYFNYSSQHSFSEENDKYIIEKTEKHIKSSVIKQLRSDVPIGIMLSGGLDSGLLLSLAVEQGFEPRCYTIRGRDYAFDESPLARKTAMKYAMTANNGWIFEKSCQY
jgi:asparagine synthase (glutamine-hydrolysing)